MAVRGLLVLFFFSYFLRFTSRFPLLGQIRFEFVLGVLMMAALLLTKQEDRWRAEIATSKKLYIFIFYIVLSLPLVTWPGSVLRFYFVDWMKVIFFFVCVVASIRTQGQLKWLLAIFLGCQTMRILEPLYLHLTTGYWGDVAYSHVGETMTGLDRLSGAPHDIVNPNQLAWVIVSMAPFIFYLLWKGGKSGKILTLAAAPPFIYCLLLTGSRSGLLSLVFVLFTIVFFSRNRVRNLISGLIIAIPVAIFAFGVLGGDMQTRYLSLVDNNVAGADTAHGRIDGLLKGIGSISNNPLFGNGLGTSRETNFNTLGGSAQITHNLYLEIFQETGFFGFTLFMMFIIAIFKSLMETKRLLVESGKDENNWLYRMANAVQVWVIMDLFYSLSCFGLRSWEWYFFGGISTVCLALAREQAEAHGALEQGSPIGIHMREPEVTFAGSRNKS